MLPGLPHLQASSQIVPDTTLPQSSRVDVEAGVHQIEGGTQAGANLFHSFEQFNLNPGEIAQFQGADNVENIITRVTGGDRSLIDGTLSSSGTANLYLLNPQGIVFGENARLDVGGSFTASTATVLHFENQDILEVESQQPLLSVNVPLGLGLSDSAAAIASRPGAQLTLPPGQTLRLVGGSLDLNQTHIEAPSGQIELIAGRSGTWSLDPHLAARVGGFDGDIRLQNETQVVSSGDGGGAIVLRGDRISLTDTHLLAETLGNTDGQAIDIDATHLFAENTSISSSTFAPGNGGDIQLSAETINISADSSLQTVLVKLFAVETTENPDQFGSGVFAMSFGEGDAGRLSVRANELTVRDGAFLSTTTTRQGRGGLLDVRLGGTLHLDGAQIVAESLGSGDAGSIDLAARYVRIDNGGGVFGSTFGAGRGASIRVRASEDIEVVGTTPNGRFNSAIAANAFPETTTTAGSLFIEATNIRILNGGGIGAVTFGGARGGTVTLRASDTLELIGVRSEPLIRANINARSDGTGNAGDIDILTDWLRVLDGAEIVSATSNHGSAGNLTIQARQGVEIRGRDPSGQVVSRVRSDATLFSPFAPVDPTTRLLGTLGAAGDIRLDTPWLRLADGGNITVSSMGIGDRAGNITIRSDRLLLENTAQIFAESEFAREGNIQLHGGTIVIRENSLISTNATGEEPGGNIFLNADTLVALSNSDITANATNSQGGRIQISVEALFGAKLRDRLTPQSDITATSALGTEFNGIVEIDSPRLEAPSGLMLLTVDPLDIEGLVVDRCGALRAGSRFAVTGRGGLPPDPTQTLVQWATWRDFRQVRPTMTIPPFPLHDRQDWAQEPEPVPEPPMEATHWLRDSEGAIVLANRNSPSNFARDRQLWCE